MMFRTNKFLVGKLQLVCAAFVIFTGCSDEEQASATPKVRPAKLVSVQAASNQRDLTFPAIIRAAQSAELTFQVSGEVRKLDVIEGMEVEEGTMISQLDQSNALNRLAQAQAEYENTQAEYKRAEQLVNKGGVSQSDLDSRKTKRDIARVSRDVARKSLNDTVLHAPFSGVISRVYVEQFQNVQSKEPVVVLQSHQIEAIVNIPGTILARSLQFEPINTSVVLDAAPEVEIPAEFRESSGQADLNTQTYELSFTFSAPEDLLILPGMTAILKTTLVMNGLKDLIPDGIAVPLASVLAEGEQTYVWVVDEETMAVAKRQVVVGPDPGEIVTVVDGLSGGETIVAAGVSFFHEGTVVRPWTPE